MEHKQKGYLLLVLHPEITPEGFKGPYRMLEMEPGLATCKGKYLHCTICLAQGKYFDIYTSLELYEVKTHFKYQLGLKMYFLRLN